MLIDYPGVNIPFGTYIKSHFGKKNCKVVFYDNPGMEKNWSLRSQFFLEDVYMSSHVYLGYNADHMKGVTMMDNQCKRAYCGWFQIQCSELHSDAI